MPDFFRGKPFPKDKDGDKDEQQKFFAGVYVNFLSRLLPLMSVWVSSERSFRIDCQSYWSMPIS